MILFVLGLTSCEKAFPKFVKKYNKEYATEEQRSEALHNFCLHYNFAKARPHNNLQINEISDLPTPPLSGYIRGTPHLVSIESEVADASSNSTIYNRPPERVKLTEAVCEYRSSSWNILDPSKAPAIFNGTLPESADLRKIGTAETPYDQGTCGSCYAEATRFVMHSLFVHDLYYYAHHEHFGKYFKGTNNRVKFSVQHIMNYTYGQNEYCAGGNFITVANDFISGRVPTLEYESDYPYISMMESDANPPAVEPERLPAKSVFSLEHPLNPVRWVIPDAIEECEEGVYEIKLVDEKSRDKLKGLLVRGIAVAGHEQVPSEQTAAMKYSMLKSSVVTNKDFPCPGPGMSNHEITFVGYGTYKGVEVWVIQNSWGSSWGVEGTAYFKIGDNALCTEEDVDFVLPRYLGIDGDLEPSDIPFNQSQLYKRAVDEKLIIDVYPEIKWGYSGLDGVDSKGEPFYIKGKLSAMAWIIVVAVALMILVCLYFVCICLVKPPPNFVFYPYYVQLWPAEAQFIEWKLGVQEQYSKIAIANSKVLDDEN